jgi:hypothetical protein
MRKLLSTQNLLMVSAFAGTLGGGLFWTGFPIAFSTKWTQYGSLSSVCAFAVAGSVLFDLIGGAVSNLKNVRAISVLSMLASALILALMIVFNYLQAPLMILALLPALYFIFSLANVAENVWLLSLGDKSSLHKTFIDRSSAVISAKLIGFSLGPILFSSLGLHGIWICFVLIALTALLQSFIPAGEPAEQSPQQQSKKHAFSSVASNPLFVLAFFCTGLLTVPMNVAFAGRVVSLGNANYAGAYWLVAGIVSFCAVRLLGGEKMRVNKFTMPLFMSISLVACLSFSVDAGALVTLVCGAFYVFTSVSLSTSLQVVGLKRFDREHLGVAIGSMNFLMDFGILIGLVLSDRAQSNINTSALAIWLPVILSLAILLRCSTQFGLMHTIKARA